MEVDMSDKAITGRLKRVEQLRRLCLSLGKAVFLPPSDVTENKPAETPPSAPQQETPDEHRNR